MDDNIDGEAIGTKFGSSVSLSSNGEIVAISASLYAGNGRNNSGHVRVYELNSNSGKWSQLGDDIDGEAENDESGVSVSLSGNGETVAVGAWYNDGNGKDSGHVRVYRLNDSLKWIILDYDIDGEAKNDYSGSVSLSYNGETVAIGANGNDGNGSRSGHVRVYNLNSNSGKWSQLGDDIDGEAEGDQSGSSVSLSDNGRIVAIAAPYNDGNGDDSGHVRVYELNESLQWIILGDDIDGGVIGDKFGFSVSLSGNGRTVAISSTPGNDDDYVYDDNTSSGYVNFYKW